MQYGSSKDFRPSTLSTEKFRYRLMFGLQPTEQLAIFNKPVRAAGQSESAYRAAVQSYWDNRAWISPISNTGATPLVTPLAYQEIEMEI